MIHITENSQTFTSTIKLHIFTHKQIIARFIGQKNINTNL